MAQKKEKKRLNRLDWLNLPPTYAAHLPTSSVTYLPVPSLSPRREVLCPRPSSSSPHGSALIEARRFPGLVNRSELQQQPRQRREEISRSYKSIGIAAAAGEQALCSGLVEQQQWKRILGITRRYPTVKI